MTRIFVGRAEEQANFRDWVSGSSDRRAALLIGPAGMGKSALLEQYEEICQQHGPKQWYVQRIRLNSNESASAFLDRVLRDTHNLMAGRLIRSGPNDTRLLKGLLKIVPGMGDILAALVGDEKRPGWQRFLDYAYALSQTLKKKNERFVLLVDPDPTVAEEQAVEWLSIAAKDGLPEEVRIVIAQRPDDAIVTNGDSKLRFHLLTGEKTLDELDRDSVIAWYEAVLYQDDFKEQIDKWTAETLRELPKAAHKHYGGYPFAHDAVVRLLKMESVDDPVARIKSWPTDLAGLMDMLFDSLAGLGEDYLRVALVIQIFSIPTPKEIWAKAAGLEVEKLTSMLANPKYGHFFPVIETNWGESHFPYHALFGARIEKELASIPERQKKLANLAWEAIEPRLDKELLRISKPREFELQAAVPVAIRQSDDSHLVDVVDRVVRKKHQLGLLDAAITDLQLILSLYGDQEAVCAVCYGNLGIVMNTRGDLDGAEAMFRKSLEIEEKLGRLVGMASDYGNLASILIIREDLDAGESMCRKALEIHEKLGRLEDMAITYGNLGIVMRLRGDLVASAEMTLKALEINEKLGRLDGMSHQYGNLGDLRLSCGDLDGSELMYRRGLEIDEMLGRREGMANHFNSLGMVMHRRANFDGSEEMYRKAIELYESIGMPHRVNETNGRLDRLAEDRAAAESETVP